MRSYAPGVEHSTKTYAHTTMAMFTPRNQIRNMLENQAAQSQINNPSALEQMFGLFILSQQERARRDLKIPDNWMDDSDLWI